MENEETTYYLSVNDIRDYYSDSDINPSIETCYCGQPTCPACE